MTWSHVDNKYTILYIVVDKNNPYLSVSLLFHLDNCSDLKRTKHIM